MRFSILVSKQYGHENYSRLKEAVNLHQDEIHQADRIDINSIHEFYRKLKGRYFGVLVDGVVLKPGALDRVEQEFTRRPEASIVYSDYWDQQEIKLLDYSNDWTERWNFGKLRFYNFKQIEAMGGFPFHYKFMFHYYLQLRFWNQNKIFRIPQVLYYYYSNRADGENENNTNLKNKLFFPAQGDLGGFSYLYYPPEINAETEKIFFDFLHREGIYFAEEPAQSVPQLNLNYPVKVSVVVPVHNRAELLNKAIASVVAQAMQNWELIVVDNNSTDHTVEVVESWQKKDKRIKLVKLTENKIARALNQGIKISRGEYIAQLDSDDVYLPQTLEVITRSLDQDLSAGLAVSFYDLIDPDDQIIEEMGVVKHLEYSVNNILRVDGAGAVRVWRKSVIQEMGGFDEKDYCNYGEDYDMVLKVTEKYKLLRIPQVLYHYRRHPGNSDMLRSEEFKLKSKNGARLDAYQRRKKIQRGTND
ncbi:MAG: hypothetical protein APR63_07435 [Desulfuromonas sp. SDB]|nr:MAG: hypothetical protein APR63_07435 [Desulfuromonas sp. SDB]